jgi:hypothetical protein
MSDENRAMNLRALEQLLCKRVKTSLLRAARSCHQNPLLGTSNLFVTRDKRH